MLKLSQFFTLGAPFVFLIPASGVFLGFFTRQEFIFQIAVSIALVAWLLDIVLRPLSQARKRRPGAIEHPVPSKKAAITLIDVAVAFFLAALFISTLVAPNFHRSFFGLLDRMTGYISMVYLGAWYVLLRVHFFNHERKVLVVMTLVAVFASLYGLFQGITASDIYHGLYGRVSGPFTNPSILAGVSLFGFFLSIFGYSVSSRGVRVFNAVLERRWRVFFAFSATVSFLSILATQTRSALLGVVTGIFLLLVTAAFSRKSSKATKKAAIIFLAGGTILLALVIIQVVYEPIAIQNPLLARLTNAEQLLGGIQNRVISWRIAWRGFLDRPVTGWGLDNYTQAFDKHFDTALVRQRVSAEAWFDKTHNMFLEMAVTTGMLGFLAYIFLFVSSLYVVVRAYRTEWRAIFFGALFVAYAAHEFFLFEFVPTYAMLFACCMILSSFSARWNVGPSWRLPRVTGTLLWVRIGASGATAVIIFAAVAYNVIPLKGMAQHFWGWQSMNDFSALSREKYEKDFSLRHVYGLYDWQYIGILLLKNEKHFRGSDEAFFNTMARYTFEKFDAVRARYVLGARDYYMAARLGNFLSDVSENEKVKIFEYLDRALYLSPDKPDIYYEIAQYYKNAGDYQKALAYLEMIRDKDPFVSFTHTNLGFAYVLNRDFNSAVESFERAIELNYDDWKDSGMLTQYLIQVYTHEDVSKIRYARLAEFYEARIGQGSKSVEDYVQLAAVYKELGEYEKAKIYARKAIEVDPRVQSAADAFIQSLNF